MSEMSRERHRHEIEVRYLGRLGQTGIILGKLLRMFLYQNDWRVLPMSALIAGLVGLVIRDRFFNTMEGTLMSALSVVCVCVWNGCFNSIQVICRERDVIKREHRSGMHISSYVLAHMIYQALPERAEPVTRMIICNYGLKLITAQSGYNDLPFVSAWYTLTGMRNNEIEVTVTMGQILDYLSNTKDPDVRQIRAVELTDKSSLTGALTVGEIVDLVNEEEDSGPVRDQTITINTSVGQLIRMVGEKEARSYVVERSSKSAKNPDYENSPVKILGYWGHLMWFVLLFAALTVITLEFIDRDKR